MEKLLRVILLVLFLSSSGGRKVDDDQTSPPGARIREKTENQSGIGCEENVGVADEMKHFGASPFFRGD